MKFLITDDSKLARLTLLKSLKPLVGESKIFQASNGKEALKIINDEKPDVVFLDLTMPVMDGYQVLPEILKINPNTKIIVVSADIQEKSKKIVIDLGALLHIQKPINSKKMQEILKTLR